MKGISISMDDPQFRDDSNADVHITNLIILTRHSFLKIKRGKHGDRRQFANFIGRVLYLAYGRRTLGHCKEYVDVRFTKNTVEIRTSERR